MLNFNKDQSDFNIKTQTLPSNAILIHISIKTFQTEMCTLYSESFFILNWLKNERETKLSSQ